MVQMNRVRVVWTGVAGTPWYSNLYTLSGAAPPATAHGSVVALLNALRTLYGTGITALAEGDIAQIESTTNQVIGVSSVAPVSVVGTSATPLLPLATQGLVRFLTGQFANGRQIRGRMSLPGLTQGSIGTSGSVNAGTVSTVNTAFGNYLTALGPAAVVFSRKNGTAVPISSATCWTSFSVLRSRRD